MRRLLCTCLLLSGCTAVPKIKQQLNVEGKKDNDLRPDAVGTAVVQTLYLELLGRKADAHGTQHYQSGAGYSVTQVVDELLNSQEFRKKYSFDTVSTTGIPVEFAQAALFQDVMSNAANPGTPPFPVTELDVKYLYNRLFDREPDEAALAAYAPVIEAKSLAVIDFITDLMRSDEYGVSFLYLRVLGRKADEEGKRHFADIAAQPPPQPPPPEEGEPPPPPVPQQEGLSLAQVADELLGSKEFIQRAAADAQAAGIDASSGKPFVMLAPFSSFS